MESAPEQLNTWDMADLSQLPAEEVSIDVLETSGPGPVRRRKTSLRANPLASAPEPSSDGAILRMRMLDVEHLPSNPHTPITQSFNPFDTQFHGLLPVFPPRDSHNE